MPKKTGKRAGKGGPELFAKYRPYKPAEVRAILAKAGKSPGPVSEWRRKKSLRFEKGRSWVFFSNTTGKKGRTVFPERIDADGVFTWISLASQGPKHPAIRSLAAHNEKKADILLFGRGSARGPYYYLGKLKFLALEPGKGKPVRIRWRILDFDPSAADLSRMRIVLAPEEELKRKRRAPSTARPGKKAAQKKGGGVSKSTAAGSAGLEEARREMETSAVLAELGAGRVAQTRRLRIRPSPWGTSPDVPEPDVERMAETIDREPRIPDADRYRMELAAETLVIETERERLVKAGRPELAERVAQASDEGDHAGYDVLSFDSKTGAEIPIAVKATTGNARAPFFLSTAEVECMEKSGGRYRIYRIYGFDFYRDEIDFYVMDMPILVWGAAVYSG